MPQTFSTVMPSGDEYGWDVDRLWKLAANLPSVMVAIDSFSLEKWVNSDVAEKFRKEYHNRSMTLDDFVLLRMDRYINDPDDDADLPRIRNASLEFPILLNEHGVLMDGYHRFIKAYFMGVDKIKTQRFLKDPNPDFVYVKDKEIPWAEWQSKNVVMESYSPRIALPPSAMWRR